MNRIELIAEIQRLVAELPEESLVEVLAYLKELLANADSHIDLSRNLDKIISEDRGLLKRLAQ